MIYTTLAKIHTHGLNKTDLAKLLDHLGTTTPVDVPIALASILESNGVGNALWCLRACDRIGQFASFFTLDLARRVYPIWHACYPADAQLARHFETAARFLTRQGHGQGARKSGP